MRLGHSKMFFKIVIVILCIATSCTAIALAQENSIPENVPIENTESKVWYTCGMHPEVIQDHPGNCPKCGMQLVPMGADRARSLNLVNSQIGDQGQGRRIVYWKSPMVPGEISQKPGKDSMGHDLVAVFQDELSSAGIISISPVVSQNMGIRLATIVEGPVTRSVDTVGFVKFDETSLTSVTTKVDGWIEKLYVEKTGSQVHEGDKLFELYSPELYSAQEEYLAALRGERDGKASAQMRGIRLGSKSLVLDARKRLELFDISTDQIERLKESQTVRKSLTIFAPSTGIVTNKGIVQGQMVKAGQDLFQIADLSSVWVIAKVFESDLPYIKVGQSALMSLSYLPNKKFRGYVTYIYPFLDEKSREVSVRIEFHNPGYELKPGMFSKVSLISKLKEKAVLIPAEAVIDTGKRKIVFISQTEGQFALRNVVLGFRTQENFVEVISGVAAGERIVVSGQFLLDSESNLREAARKFLEPTSTQRDLRPVEVENLQTSELSKVEQVEYYACPMPEHVDTLYESPGKCPLCGMTLVPANPGFQANVSSKMRLGGLDGK